MGSIVCATRGGEGSRAVQLEAIRRCKVSERPLIFLFVIDPETLGEIDESLRDSIQSELDWMGKTLLQVAHQRAELAGLDSQVVIRNGTVRNEISTFLKETHAELLLLGAPRGTTANVFGDDAVEKFALLIQEETGVPVEVVRPESVRRAESEI